MEYFAAVGLPFLILILAGPGLIKGLRFLNFGQQIRKEGPASHKKKKGVPTMGGILILFAVLLTSFIILDLRRAVFGAIITMTIMGLVGFLDDIIKIRSKMSLGLKARQKLVGQFFTGLILALYVFFYTDTGTSIIIPFSGYELELGYWFLPFVIFTVVALANAVNLTDGLDGLAAGVIIIVISALAVIVSALGYKQLTLFSLIVCGACVGFIWFNSHPAQVFMGDVGSLALGGALAAVSILSRTELFLLIIGGLFVLETLSVIIQVVYFRFSGGERIFKMTPIHHHYELTGLEESKIVARFWIMSFVFAIMGLLSFYLIL